MTLEHQLQKRIVYQKAIGSSSTTWLKIYRKPYIQCHPRYQLVKDA